MIFDEILPTLIAMFEPHQAHTQAYQPILLNRDLFGRVRLILDKKWLKDTVALEFFHSIAENMHAVLGPHAFPVEQAMLFEEGFTTSFQQEKAYPLGACTGVYLVDRLVTESKWGEVAPPTKGAPRVVFYSIKGGVGRSTALAASAWKLAEQGKKIFVLDLDLESPGLSTSLLPEDRRPDFGITDWLVEDLVDQGDLIFKDLFATSNLSEKGNILVVPAHGKDPKEYIAKLGRAYMPKIHQDGRREPWAMRLSRLLDQLEARLQPDLILIDSRAGIDETASAVVTDLGATRVLLFALDGDQTWSGYRILFQHWRKVGGVREIRARLQMVGSMLPEVETLPYAKSLLERSWSLFLDEIYDDLLDDQPDSFNFAKEDDAAPHFTWHVRWHRGFAALKNLHRSDELLDAQLLNAVFGELTNGLSKLLTN